MNSNIKIKKGQIEDYAVQKTGDQTIDGQKIFTLNPQVSHTETPNAVVNLEQMRTEMSNAIPDTTLDAVLSTGNTSVKSIILEKPSEANDLALSADGLEFSNYGGGIDNLTLKWTTSGDGQLFGTEIKLPKKSGTLVVLEDIASVTQSGIINNTSLQELGGKDKLINGVRIGKGDSIATSNTILGRNAGTTINDGTTDNTLIGENVGGKMTTGDYNVAIGSNALVENTTGISNVFVGAYAGWKNTVGARNIGIGSSALLNLDNSPANIAIGDNSLTALVTNAIGRNIALGNNALQRKTAGRPSIGIGTSALTFETAGGDNIAIGDFSGSSITTGARNIIVGVKQTSSNAGNYPKTGNDNLIIMQGKNGSSGTAIGIETGSGNTILGFTGTAFANDMSNNVYLADGIGNVAIRKLTDNTLLAPSQTNALIDADATGKALVTKECLQNETSSATTLTEATTVVLTANKNINYFANTGGATTWTLPSVNGNTGKQIIIVNKGSGNIAINTYAGNLELFDGAPLNAMPLVPGATYGLYCDGAHWTALY